MTGSGSDRVRDLFVAGLELEPAERRAFLRRECGSDAALLAEVESLLEHHGEDESLLAVVALRAGLLLGDGPAAAAADLAVSPLAPGARIGSYTITSLLGSGGMGTIYEAEQDNPRRRVALKLLRSGAASAAHMGRLRLEAQVLGRLQHPGIAQIFEAGAFDSPAGPVPYFAMELIRGEPLHRYFAAHGPDLRQRVKLLVAVCDAVDHAHRHGVVHRDLKPDNILVDAAGRPKVIDFGIARLLDPDARLTLAQTRAGELVGTLQYMSPEQVAAEPGRVDTRSDVYALGVIAYEILAGRGPYDLSQRTLTQVAHIIAEREPERLGVHRAALRGDLELIVEQAMAKEPARRYPNAGELAADLRRFLDSRPVLARRPSAAYLVSRFARRHRLRLAAAGLVGAAVVISLLIWRQQSRLASEAQSLAARHALVEELTSAATATGAGTPGRAREILEGIAPDDRGWEWDYLASDLDRSVFSADLGEKLVAACVAPDRASVLTLLRSGELARRPLAGADPPARLALDAAGLRAACFSEDGQRVAALFGAAPAGLALWDTGTGQRLASWDGIEADPELLTLEGDRLRVAWYPAPTSLSVWDSGTDQVRTYPFAAETFVHGTRPLALRGDRIAIQIRDHGIALLDGAGPDVADPVAWATQRNLTALAFSSDGRRLAVAAKDKRVRILDVATGACSAVLAGHTGTVHALAFTRDDTSLVTIADDENLRRWNLASGTSTPLPTGPEEGRSARIGIGPDGGQVLTVAGPGLVRLWDEGRRDGLGVLRGHSSYVYSVGFSPDGRTLASGSWDGTARLWSVETGALLWSEPVARIVWELRFSPTGESIAACANNPPLRWLDPATGDTEREVGLPFGDQIHFEWFPDGERLLVTGDVPPPSTGAEALVLDARDGRILTRLEVARSSITAVAVAPDGEHAAFGSADGLTLWDLAGASPPQALAGATHRVRSLAFNPDGQRLAAGLEDGTACLFDVRTGKPLQTLTGHRGNVYSVAWSPDGSRLATGAQDSVVRLFDPDWPDPLLDLRGHEDYVHSVAFSPDGMRLASASGDGTVRLWDARPLRERGWAGERRQR